jgi:hypothetical protein
MDDIIQVQDQFYILATASRAGERTAVLQHDDTFAVFDLHGDMGVFGTGEQGLYHEGTRYLSRFRLRLNGQRPLLLSARVKDDNELFGADLTNPDLSLGPPDVVLSRDIVHLFRARFLWNGICHESIRLWNYGRAGVQITLTFDLDADFADIFEVRGTRRGRRGVRLDPVASGRELRFHYRGLDGEERWTVIEFSDPPAAMAGAIARFEYDLPPQTPASMSLAIRCERERRSVMPLAFSPAMREAAEALEAKRRDYATIDTSSERFNQWVRRSAADLRMLVSATPYGDYPYAGVPWFSTPFGRDGVIAALQTLWINPKIARGVIAYLAATQADGFDAAQDAEPGKILHETRSSEMARLGEVPFGRYYGSVDATPLFVIAAGAYFERTGDRAFLAAMWPHVDRALDWIDRYGDSRRRRLRRVRTPIADRAGAAGVEGLAGFGLPRGRLARRRADCAGRSAGLCLRRAPARGGDGRCPGRRGACGSPAPSGRSAARGLRRPVLVRRASHLRPGARRSETSRAGCARPMPATACSAASPRRSAPAWSVKAWSTSRCFRAGAFGRSRPRSCATTRCRTTTDRCGLTTTG